MTEEERHRAPALWLVVAALAVAVVVAAVVGAFEGLVLLSLTLAAAGVARVVGRGRRPEGVAVRSTWQDAAVLVALAVTIAVLAATPGVGGDTGGGPRSGAPQERVSSSSTSTTSSSVTTTSTTSTSSSSSSS